MDSKLRLCDVFPKSFYKLSLILLMVFINVEFILYVEFVPPLRLLGLVSHLEWPCFPVYETCENMSAFPLVLSSSFFFSFFI